jgi:Trypsin
MVNALSARRRGARLLCWTSVGLLALLGLALLQQTPASASTIDLPAGTSSAEVNALEVSSYQDDFDVSRQTAEEHLEVQKDGAGIVELLERAQGSEYAGVWFDNEGGEFVVPTVSGAGRAAVEDVFADSALEGDFRTKPVESSWTELEAAQKRIDGALLPLFEAGVARTFIDPKTNAVIVDLAAGATGAERSEALSIAKQEHPGVEVRSSQDQSFGATLSACNFQEAHCDAPMRGGVGIAPKGTLCCGNLCTAAFKAKGNLLGNRFMLTAGHCVVLSGATKWVAYTTNQNPVLATKDLGTVDPGDYVYPNHDYAAIKANGTYWDQSPWPTVVTNWGVNQEHPITSEGYSYVGQSVCHAGQQTGLSCGPVTATGLTEVSEDASGKVLGVLYNLTRVAGICVIQGDSGGPVWSGNTALGIFSSADKPKGAENPCGWNGYYNEITEAADALGVSVAPRVGAPPPPPPPPPSRPDVLSIAMNGTGTKTTEVHVLTGPSLYQAWGLHTGTLIGETQTSQWQWAAALTNNDSYTDLVGVSMNGTGSGKTEVHVLNGATNYQSWLLQTATPIGETQPSKWQWLLGDTDVNGDGIPDLVGVNMNGTGSKKTELHILSGASNYQSWVLQTQLPLGETQSSNWQWLMGDANNDNSPDLIGVNMNGTGSKKTEFHILSGATLYQTWLTHTATPLGETQPTQWQWTVEDENRDGKADVVGVAMNGTGSNKTEFHILNAATNYQTWIHQLATPLGQSLPSQWRFIGGP